MVKELESAKEFDEAKGGSKIAVFDFFAEWCGPCKAIAPEIEKLSKQDDMTSNDVKFYKVNVDKCDELAAKMKVSAMPTFVLFKDGNEVERIVGARIDKIKEAIKKHT